MSALVQVQREGAVSLITLNDRKANAMSVAMLGEFNAALDQAQADATVVVITGREGMFCAGFDLNVFKGDQAGQLAMLEAGAKTAERLLAFPAPVVIACSGHAIAMGAFLVLAGDLRIANADERFRFCVNEVQIGMTVPHFAIELCRQRLAPAHFNRAVLTATPYTPTQAKEAGFVDELVPAAQFMETAMARATTLAGLVRESYVATKRRLRAQVLATVGSAVEADVADWRSRFKQA